MKDIVVVGAGKIGSTIAEMLAATGDYHVTIVDRSAAQLAAARRGRRRRDARTRHRQRTARSKQRWPASSRC